MKESDYPTKNILGIPIASLTLKETVEFIEQSIEANKPIHHVVVNAGKIVSMQKDKLLFDSVIGSDLINADGQAVVWASKFLSKPLPERVTGIDLMINLVELSAVKKQKIYLLGARKEIVQKLVNIYKEDYGEGLVASFSHGYFTEQDEEALVEDIAKSGASMLFLGMSSPKKEIFLNKYKKKLNIPLIMGVGGAFDVLAGKVKRAPVWMQKAGLEWFYRFLQEPRRMWKRYLYGNIMFIYFVFKEKFKGEKK